jgi:hypothetical protein
MPPSRLARHLDARWSSWLTALGCVMLFSGVMALSLRTKLHPSVELLGLGLLAFGVLGQLTAVIWRLCHRRWLAALGQLGALLGLLVLASTAFAALALSSMFGPSEDNFANNLTAPPDAAEPDAEYTVATVRRLAPDPYQTALQTALTRPGGTDTGVLAKLDATAALARDHRDLLRRYLASSPAWRLHEDRGHVFAIRRARLGETWRYTLNGYLSSFSGEFTDTGSFQTRLALGLDEKPWWRGDGHTTTLSPGKSTPVELSEGNLQHESHCLIPLDHLLIEIFEQSDAPERRLTKTTVAYLEAELATLLAQPTETGLRALLPPDAITRDQPAIRLNRSFQPGIYDVTLRLNPGEPGRIHLRAFEVTQETPLSADRLKDSSNEWIGWSSDPTEQFLSNTHITIYEGDWGQPYGARFEVWFEPDSGAPARKLAQRVFKIEGWQR